MYSKSITRNNRALFVLAIDQSCSMAGVITVAGRTTTKAEMVAEVANEFIDELIERSRRSEGIRDYYDIAIIGYSGEGVYPLLGSSEWLSVAELTKRECPEVLLEREYITAKGEIHFIRQRSRRWISATATGSTPMYEALLVVRDIVEKWCSKAENRGSFPPVISNITDGESTDCDYDDIAEIASRIKETTTEDGNSLLINIHIASHGADSSLIFPSLEQIAQQKSSSRAALSLFHAASELPSIFMRAATQIKGISEVTTPLKAMSFNCSTTELLTILNIGSISIKRN